MGRNDDRVLLDDHRRSRSEGFHDRTATLSPEKRFPTALHEEVAALSRDFFLAQAHVDTVLVVNSCARGQAVPESDLDLAVLVGPTASANDLQSLEAAWLGFMTAQTPVQRFRQASRFGQVHLDLFNGRFVSTVWEPGGGPDEFELEIGNRLAYSAPLGEPGDYYQQLRTEWLPYYEDELRLRRLAMVRDACLFDLDHVPFLAGRGLHFAAFDWLYKAFREFLQALFIARRTYPVSYTKWIREQVVDWLTLPELYSELPPLLSVTSLESQDVCARADAMRRLLQAFTRSER